MTQQFIKDNIVCPFKVENGKVLTTIILGEYSITNPTLEQFLSIGWEEYVPEPMSEPTPYVPTLEELVERKIRNQYSLNQEFEVQRKRDTEPETFAEYYQFVEDCIAEAKTELNIE